MCGRFTITVDRVETILERFKAEPAPDFKNYTPRFNAAPTQFVPAIVAKEDGKRYLTNLFWSLTPPWAEREGSKYPAQINVRDDTIEKNKFFRTLLTNQRCIFVADGFYEWKAPAEFLGKTLPRGIRKTPYRIHFKNGDIMPLAGLWRSREEGEKKVLSGAIITTTPNALMAPIHNRMPVVLQEKAIDHWLDPTYKNYDQLRLYLCPVPDTKMKAYEVSAVMNNAKVDSPGCIKEVQ